MNSFNNSPKPYPEPVVGALVFNKKGEVILMTSWKFNGKYIVPGGHIEIWESMEEALKRELKEETNLDIEEREADSYVWVKPEDALKLDLNKSTRVFVEKYIQRQNSVTKMPA